MAGVTAVACFAYWTDCLSAVAGVEFEFALSAKAHLHSLLGSLELHLFLASSAWTSC